MDKSPDAFRTISEVAELLETPAHVLRFWESRFPQIRPVKRAGGRRYYRPADVALLTGIRHLLHDEGLTIRGVQKILREQGVRHVSGGADDVTLDEDDAALEAALAASGGDPDDSAPLPAAEAETAQIIALQSALSQPTHTENAHDGGVQERVAADLTPPDDGPADQPEPLVFESVPAAPEQPVMHETLLVAAEPPTVTVEPDLFSRFEPVSSAQNTLPQDNKDSQIMRSFEGLGAASSSSPSNSDPLGEGPATEAPMEMWAEEGPPAATPAPLKITQIKTPKPLGPDTEKSTATGHPHLAARLRALRAGGLSSSDRATLSVLRAKARSLRDRLGSQPRSGSGTGL